MMLDEFVNDLCVNCGKELIGLAMYPDSVDFCDIECAKEFDLMALEQRLEEE